MSQFVWLDYSEHERRKMLDVIDLFREHDTVDELGTGSVRDTFADLFFPGTSTIMTRARYFLIVPWIYQRLEKQRVGSDKIADRARRAEIDLIAVIDRSDDNEGNVGTLARTALKRLPSNIYWQGLGIWGIRMFPGSQAQYHRSLDRYYIQQARHAARGSERDIEHDDLVVPNWHAGLIAPPSKFPGECSLSLSRDEAEYLGERIRLSTMSAGSLLAELCARRQDSEQADFVWDHPYIAALPPQLRELVDHARNFSELIHGGQLLYNLILAEQTAQKEYVSRYREGLADWAKLISNPARVFASWSCDRFWELVRAANPRIKRRTRDFIDSWWDIVVAGKPSAVHSDRTARVLIRERERHLKKNLARIDNPRAQEQWQGASGAAQLDYRWGITQQLLDDIFTGLDSDA